MSRLIDVDQLKKEWHMGDICETCSRDTRQCGNDYCFSRMDVCGMLDDAPTANGWISVKDRMPEENVRVLVYAQTFKAMFVDKIADKKWFVLPEAYEVTHWMPLPAKPKEEEHD